MTNNDCDRWKHCINKEDKLRLKWFTVNEENLLASTVKKNTRAVTKEDIDELKATRKELHSAATRHPRHNTDDPPNEKVECSYQMMRPVLPEHTKLLYNSSNEGRVKYLRARVEILPENRYYFPEASSFQYGWKMWECAKTMEGTKCGKSAIVRHTFYRRRAGIERDPDWYTQPAKTSPTMCNCT